MNLADLVTRHAAATPDSPAVIDHGRTCTWRELDAAVWQAAAALRKQGIAAGDVVGVRLPNGLGYLVTVYALARLNAVFLAAGEHDSDLAGRFRAKAILASAPQGDPGPVDPSLRGPGGDATWRIGLTSGSTGRPKAVRITHAMQIAWCESNQGAVPGRPDDRFLSALPLDLDAGLRICLFVHWAGGAVLFEQVEDTVERFFATVERVGANYLSLTPVHLGRLLDRAPEGKLRLPRVRVLRSGGMFHDEKLQSAVRRRLSPNFFVLYGTKDGGSPLTCATGDTFDRHPGSVGFPCPGVEIGIADESGRALPAGEQGLVRMKAPGMTRGYIDDPEASARSFRDGWYYTGDRGTLSSDGALYFGGRADDLINYDGIKLYPAEIENVLQTHPAVVEVAAFALPDPQHQDLPVAAVVLRAMVSEKALRDFCRARIGARTPRRVVFVDALPRTRAGKVDKAELARRCTAKDSRARDTQSQ
jgi:acyl-CoA synthetase (AMP-forming)/AMP-acid ligase II